MPGQSDRVGVRHGLGAWALAALAAVVPGGALAQRVDENPVTAAEDAFGAQVGAEKIGIYNDQDVRGFNPVKAGNIRIEGVYFDQVAQSSARWRLSSAIRVGAAALDYPFPAPTGIVDLKVRPSGDEWAASVGLGRDPWGGTIADVDLQVPVIRGRLSVGAGVGYLHQEQVEGASQEFRTLSVIPRLRFEGGEILGIVGYVETHHIKSRPLITASGPFTPPIPKERRYLGQRWTAGRNDALNAVAIARFDLSESWSVRAGLVDSQILRSRSFTEVFTVATPDGAGRHRVIADPQHFERSISGEAQVVWKHGSGRLRHRLLFMVRGRDRLTETGGADVIDLGPVVLGDFDHEPEPAYRFGPVDEGRIEQMTYGVGYVGRLGGVVRVNLGLQKTDYAASLRHLDAVNKTVARPWLYNGAVTLKPKPWLSLFATYVRGLEESGTAPENAANRNEQLKAARTVQIDGGVQVTRGSTRLVAAAFQIEKPYFSFDSLGRYTDLGEVRHRGLEVSLSQDIGGLHLLAGAVLMDPVVTGEARATGLVGKRPVGTTPAFLRLDADYQTSVPGLSLSGALVYAERRTASARGYAALGGDQLEIPASTVVDLGLRYRFDAGQVPMSLRVLVGNVFNDRSWKIVAANTYQPADTRRVTVGLAADF